MVTRTQTLDQRLMRRRCLACGYDGALLRDGLASHCARCSCDLRKRPARSYVEMEGLPGGTDQGAKSLDPALEAKLVHRWVAFVFLVMSGLVMVIYLWSAAFSV